MQAKLVYKADLTISALRQNLFQVIDDIITTGDSVEFNRNGKQLRISLVQPESKMERLARTAYPESIINGDPEALIDLKLGEWNELRNLDNHGEPS